ncbi:MAG: T9SS type A sorting domain-containing protein [Chitinophagales bacterium]|nr:T9SS type A sorting domain-containing protein [Chitinophagales bacterium]
MENIDYGADVTFLIGVEVVVRDDYAISTPIDVYYEFDVEELIGSDSLSVGGVHFGVPMHLEPLPDLDLVKHNPQIVKPEVRITTFNAYPNPFTDALKIAYNLPKDGEVSITLSNVVGQTVTIIEQGNFKTAGKHKTSFNSGQLAEGVYFITFKSGEFVQTKKIVLMR